MPAHLTGDTAKLWAVDYWQSEAARDALRSHRSFSIVVAHDGSFHAEDVLAGEYKLSVVAGDVYLNATVMVPEMTGSDSGKFDLGTFYPDEPAVRQTGGF